MSKDKYFREAKEYGYILTLDCEDRKWIVKAPLELIIEMMSIATDLNIRINWSLFKSGDIYYAEFDDEYIVVTKIFNYIRLEKHNS